MPKIYDPLKPQGNYPAAYAEDIEMPNGSRLSEFKPVSSWNDLTDKPFGVEQAFEPIVFDGYSGGVPDGMEWIDIKPIVGNLTNKTAVTLVKVSIPTAPASSYDGAVVACTHPSVAGKPRSECVIQPLEGSSDVARLYHFKWEEYWEQDDAWTSICNGWIAVITGENDFGVPVGVYVNSDAIGEIYSFPGKIFKEITKPIDEKYLPMDAIRQNAAPSVVEGAANIEPETYYQFGEVDALDLTLVEKDDGMAHEYLFEFIPGEGFAGLTISPEITWIVDPQFPVGKRCVVSVCMGMAVMGCG